jgi:hypothetical protein
MLHHVVLSSKLEDFFWSKQPSVFSNALKLFTILTVNVML